VQQSFNALFDGITQGLRAILQFFYGFSHDYTVAIILLTLVVKLILHPLTRTQLRSMRGMQLVAPHVEGLRRKYKDDPKTLNQEVMKLYKAHNLNPAMGCLPMVVQMPVFIALWRLLYRKGLFGAAAVFGVPWMRLDQAPNLGQIMIQVSAGHPERLALLLFPVLIFGTMWMQQRLTITDPQQARMLILMPVMMAWFATIYPLGVSIYMIVSTLAYIGEYLLVVGRPHPMIAAPPKSQAQPPAARETKPTLPQQTKQPVPAIKGKKGAKRR
jgi:YidC/Oxa1 family membrane protein insertase